MHCVRGQPVVRSLHNERVHLQKTPRVNDRGMRVSAHDHTESLSRGLGAKSALGDLAGNRKSRQVAGRATRDEASASRFRQPGLVREHT
jgi:hypothetical protein